MEDKEAVVWWQSVDEWWGGFQQVPIFDASKEVVRCLMSRRTLLADRNDVS